MALTLQQAREFIAAVDECRRLQIVTPRPPNALAARKIREAESKVDALLVQLREPDPVDVVLVNSPPPPAAPIS